MPAPTGAGETPGILCSVRTLPSLPSCEYVMGFFLFVCLSSPRLLDSNRFPLFLTVVMTRSIVCVFEKEKVDGKGKGSWWEV